MYVLIKRIVNDAKRIQQIFIITIIITKCQNRSERVRTDKQFLRLCYFYEIQSAGNGQNIFRMNVSAIVEFYLPARMVQIRIHFLVLSNSRG